MISFGQHILLLETVWGAETIARICDKTPQIFSPRYLLTADSEQESAALIGRRFLLRICGQKLESAAWILRSARKYNSF